MAATNGMVVRVRLRSVYAAIDNIESNGIFMTELLPSIGAQSNGTGERIDSINFIII